MPDDSAEPEHADQKADTASEKLKERALGPAADEFGKEIVPLGKKAGQLANRVGDLLLRALEPLVYGLEKSADWIEAEVTKRLKDVPEDKIRSPDPRIAVPALQALTYSMGDDFIREMFANLLAADMNADTKANTHPAFVELIKEMTPLDAKILRIVRGREQTAFYVRVGSTSKFFTVGTYYSFQIEGVAPNQISRSLDNLERLGVIDFRDEYPLSGAADKMEADYKNAHREFADKMSSKGMKAQLGVPENQGLDVTCKRQGIYMNVFGASFADVCLSPE